MREEDFYVPDEPFALRMENDLLALENRYLKSRPEHGLHRDDDAVTQKIEAAVKAERDRILEKVAEDNEERRRLYRSVPHDEYARLRKAESDMRWMVRRVENSPAGFLFRRFSGWRNLLERYGDDT